MALPLWVESEDFIASCSSANSACHMMAGLDQRIDYMRGYEGIGAGEKGGWHGDER
jgi:hypothetical protein